MSGVSVPKPNPFTKNKEETTDKGLILLKRLETGSDNPGVATDEQGPFEDTDDFFSENKTHLDSLQTTPYEEEYI